MTDLASGRCEPCEKGMPPLPEATISVHLGELPGWSIEDGKLTRDVTVSNFQVALDLVNAIGAVAESENHHPDLAIHGWNHVRVELYTHSIGGLSGNDFILAAKIDPLIEAA